MNGLPTVQSFYGQEVEGLVPVVEQLFAVFHCKRFLILGGIRLQALVSVDFRSGR